MVLKGLPHENRVFVVAIIQSDKSISFQDFKVSLHNFEENEKALSSNVSSSVMRVNNIKWNQIKGKSNRPIICYSCGVEGHKSNDAVSRIIVSGVNFVGLSHIQIKLAESNNIMKKLIVCQDNVSEVKPPSFVFTVSQNDGSHPKEKLNSRLMDYGATSHSY